MQEGLEKYFDQIVVPKNGVKKGENGRVLVLGGSKLFHAASFWSSAMAAKLVDLVHFSSPAIENNELMRIRAKEKFWEGIVIPWEEVDHYIEEDEAILIGPGMPRDEGLMQGERRTAEVVNELLAKYPQKKWVVDGGALQEVEVKLLRPGMIVTPNEREWRRLGEKVPKGVTAIVKGQVDRVIKEGDVIEVTGGNAGMIKGGTGDVLSGLVVGLYAKSPALSACVTASYVNKLAGERLYKRVGPYYSPLELLAIVPELLWETVKKS